MINKKISQLTAYAAPIEADLLPIVDVTAKTTKKITLANLRSSVVPFLTVGFSNASYICDGTDDNVQIQQALDDCNTAGGGIVFIKEGTYQISAKLSIYSNTHLKGSGDSTIFKPKDVMEEMIINSDIVNGNNNITISDFKIDADYKAGNYKAVPLNLWIGVISFVTKGHACTNCKVFNMTIIKVKYMSAISYYDSLYTQSYTPTDWYGSEIAGCYIGDIGITELYGKGIRTLGMAYLDIHDNYIGDCGAQAIHTARCFYIDIHDNIVYKAGTVGSDSGGIWLSYDSCYSKITDNIVGSNTTKQPAIFSGFAAAIGNVIANNVIWKCYSGISFFSQKTVVEGNTIESPRGYGIIIGQLTAGANNSVVSNNVIYDPLLYAIHNINSSDLKIEGNYIYKPNTPSGSYSAIQSECGSSDINRVAIINNTISACTHSAIRLQRGSSSKDHLYCNISGNNIAGGLNGIEAYMGNGIMNKFDNNIISGPSSYGIFINSGNKNTISGNSIKGDIQCIYIYTTDNIITNNYLEPTNAGRYGIYEQTGADYNIITGNNVRNNAGKTFYLIGANTKVRGNLGYVTENSGTGTITAAATSATITHGLSVTPTVDDISIIGAENPDTDVGTIWVDTIGATTFKVNVENAPGASGFDFGWRAVVL